MVVTILLLATSSTLAGPQERLTADNPNPPASTVKLIFIHHSTGGNWLANPNQDQPYGGLGIALMNNNYFVSATNYEWGPDNIGDRTDIPNWPEWFTGPNSNEIMAALYNENGQNVGDFGSWSRLPTNPGGENEIVMFKSCFPNSDLWGNPDDPPYAEPNDWEYSVSNAKAVYNKILTYFATRQDKLFIVITAPPLMESETAPERATNARAFNNWLVNDWLDGYLHNNVAVFDYYNVLTSNGSATRVDDPETNEEPNDAGWGDGNHHRWRTGAEQHIQTINNNYSAYPSGDSHPTTAGHQKATAEFVQLLNVFYHRWKEGVATPTPTATGTPSTPTPTATRTATATSVPPTSTPTRTPTRTATGAPPTSTPTRTPTRTGAPPTYRFVYLPLIMKGWSVPLPTPTPTSTTVIPSRLIQPSDLEYLGAFRLPDDAERPRTFEYGGNAMTFNPNGDPSGPANGFPGSLFITGHDRLPYGELPDGSQVAEIRIPVPVVSENLADLNQAEFIQGFHDVAEGFFTELEEIPRIGMVYLDTPATGPKIHLAWGQHLQPETPVASHAWFDPNLAAPDMQETWFIGHQSLYSVNGYMFEILASWADTHVQGRYLGTGHFKDGGWSGMGPALFAYRPWIDESGTPALPGTHLEETVLLLYESSMSTDNIEQCMDGYQHPDEWEGGAWLTTGTGKSAVLFAGTKSTGAKYWYGFVNPAGPEYPCVEEEMVGEFTLCRLADGTPCPPEDLTECQGHNDYRGWWSSWFDARFILYDPADLARVAAGEIASWEPQPYATLDVDEYLFLNPAGVEPDMLGTGVQRRYRIGDVAYDRENALLYVLELYADGAKPVVHVWHVEG
jgi:hypothetical protein